MAINPTTFNHYGEPLKEAAEELTLKIALALKTLHLKMINDPDDVIRYRRNYDAAVRKAILEWQKARKLWVNESLPAAYNRGIRHADAEIRELRKLGIVVGEPDQSMTEDMPLMSATPPL